MRSSGWACAGVTRKPGCTLGTSITRDPALTTAVGEGIQAVTGELFAPDLSPEAQRLVGKRCNSALLVGCGPRGLLEQLHNAGGSMTLQEAELARVAWWAQFPLLSTFVRAWLGWIRVLCSSGEHLRRNSGKRSPACYWASFLGGSAGPRPAGWCAWPAVGAFGPRPRRNACRPGTRPRTAGRHPSSPAAGQRAGPLGAAGGAAEETHGRALQDEFHSLIDSSKTPVTRGQHGRLALHG